MDNSVVSGSIMDIATTNYDVKAVQDLAEARQNNVSNAATNDLAAYQQYMAMQKTRPIARVNVKVHRNDPCPCGSGKKYKNCCLASGKYEETKTL